MSSTFTLNNLKAQLLDLKEEALMYSDDDLVVFLEYLNRGSTVELKIWDTITHLYFKFGGSVFYKNNRIAENSGCDEKSVRRFKNKFGNVFFKLKRRQRRNGSNSTQDIIFTDKKYVHFLGFLKGAIGHIGNYKNWRKTIIYEFYNKSLSMNMIFLKRSGVMNNKASQNVRAKTRKNVRALALSISSIHISRSTKQNSGTYSDKFENQNYESQYIRAFKTSDLSEFTNIPKHKREEWEEHNSPYKLKHAKLKYLTYNQAIRYPTAFMGSLLENNKQRKYA